MTDPEPFIRDRRWVIDFALCLVLLFVATAPYQGEGFIWFLSAVLALSVLFRRTLPVLAIAMATASCLGQLVAFDQPTTSLFALPILIFSVARWTDGQLCRITLMLGLAGSILGPLRWSLGLEVSGTAAVYGLAMMIGGLGGVAAVYVIGRRRREAVANSQERAQSLVERQRLMLAEQEQRVRSTTVEERNRIARELHDIVAHSLSVIVVQAEGGRALAAKRPEKAGEVLGTIAETSREALEEMRRMVSLLRQDGSKPESAAYVPTPGLDDIGELVRKTSEHASFEPSGRAPRVSQALGLSVYRIVQESLTNVLKHAGPAAVARVEISYAPDMIFLQVADDGVGSAAPSDGLGHGLRGMQERAALHGGTVITERRASGFIVRAWLPFTEPSVRLPIDRFKVGRR